VFARLSERKAVPIRQTTGKNQQVKTNKKNCRNNCHNNYRNNGPLGPSVT